MIFCRTSAWAGGERTIRTNQILWSEENKFCDWDDVNEQSVEPEGSVWCDVGFIFTIYIYITFFYFNE